ncbi:MAG TPA: polyphosphate kinase 2 [Egicoccus sp.]|nr:polyphosphate kinase 2 [Egicoccus sp.]HSK22168.1 polyphosphate kinase 2 [Egicoccus sp.]
MGGSGGRLLGPDAYDDDGRLRKKPYKGELLRLQVELVRLQAWVKETGYRAVVLFEGRDAAGKGGAIERITAKTSPRVFRTVALGVPSDREKTQWYFQRYVEQLPAAGEIVLFDRSWYNRAGVERVMGFATEEQVEEFFVAVPEFERMLQRAGIAIVKYWFSISDEEQERRFRSRATDPTKQWKLSEMDVASWQRWEDYSRAKDEMFLRTDTDDCPWWVVDAEVKRHARLNCIAHLLDQIPYEDLGHEQVDLPARPDATNDGRLPLSEQHRVPRRY